MENLIVIRTLAEMQELRSSLASWNDFIAFDTETTGLEKGSEIIGFSVAHALDTAYYIILSKWDVKTKRLIPLETKEGAKAFLSALLDKPLIMQNAVFDCGMVEDSYGVNLMPSVHTDTLLLGHLLNENRANGLKERAIELYGEDDRKEQLEMKASVVKNGGMLTKACYELYKADSELIAKYGAKDAILTLKIFYNDVPLLFEEGLDKFFYEEETMPLLRGPTYEMNRTGLAVDPNKLQELKQEIELNSQELRGFIYKEIAPLVKDKYKGTSKANTFNIGAPAQLAWLLFFRLDNEFNTLTDSGKEVCKALGLKIPYTRSDKKYFLEMITQSAGREYCEARWNSKTKKMAKPKKIRDPWNYLACGKETLGKLKDKYRWVEAFLKYSKEQKILKTYVLGIQSRMKYNTIRPEFKQSGTTSGRYSSKNPNFQNLPREDKRVKACIVSRPGKVFVGADYSQLEPRVFASISGDERLQRCFADGDDFYSVVGAPIWQKEGYSLKKSEEGSFAKEFPELRQIAKEDVSLASPYGTTAWTMARSIGKSVSECQAIINSYFSAFPKVYLMMLDSHEQVKTNGVVYNLFGRPRRIPDALSIRSTYGDVPHEDLPYAVRGLLNLAMNHRIQSTGASIMNRAAIAVYSMCQELAQSDEEWHMVKIIMQVHDELILEVPKHLAEAAATLLKHCMELTVRIPGVELLAEPKIANNLKDLK